MINPFFHATYLYGLRKAHQPKAGLRLDLLRALVAFGTTPAIVHDTLIEILRNQEALVQTEPDTLFNHGERILITASPFTDMEGIYQMTVADQRVMVLIELMSKSVKICLAPSALQKVS